MAELTIFQQPAIYKFDKSGFVFQVVVQAWDSIGIHPRDVLIKELEEVLEVLKKQPNFSNFKLPPVSPSDSLNLPDEPANRPPHKKV